MILTLVGSIILGIVISRVVFVSQNPSLSWEKNSECPFFDKQNKLITLTGDANFSRGELLEFTNLNLVPHNYVVKLWKKGYHWCDILQLWNWKIPEIDAPNLNAQQRIGVINSLFVMVNLFKSEEKYTGRTGNCVVIVRKIPSGEPQINIDSGYCGSMLSWDKPEGTKNNIKKIINLTLKLENSINPANYQINILNAIGAKNFGQEKKVSYGNTDGKSAGSAIYSALLSALHKKPISRQVAATGRICGKAKEAKTTTGAKMEFPAGTNLPIRGMKAKITGATKEGINCFLLSKYQTSPNLLSLVNKNKFYDKTGKFHVEKKWSLKDDYQQEVPVEIKTKIKEIHWTENIQDLKNLLLRSKLS